MKNLSKTEFITHTSSHDDGALIDMRTSLPLGPPQEAADSLTSWAEGVKKAPNPVYSRLYNPTVAAFEEALAKVEGTDSAVAFASGMAAITAVLLAAKSSGSHVVAVRPLYGGTDFLLASGLLGLDVTFTRAEELAKAIRPETGLVIVETPANPTLELIDIEQIRKRIGDLPMMVDSTFATPILQNPAAFGATMVVHSATKYIGGHSDVLGGVVATNEEWAQKLRQIRIATGGVLHPEAAYLLRRGLATLPLRVEAAQASAITLANRLREHQAVAKVYFPGLKECDPQGLVGRQMRGPGAMVSFEVQGLKEAQALMSHMQLITPAVSLGSTDSLIQHPASLTHQLVGDEGRKEGGVGPGLLRLSVGLEDVEDLWRDLDQGLAQL